MGMWLLEESRRAWAQAGDELGYETLFALAAEDGGGDVPLFEPDADDVPGHGRHAGAHRGRLRAHGAGRARGTRAP